VQKPESSKLFLLILAAAAVLGLALVPILLLQPDLHGDTVPLRRPVIAVLYSAVCVLGIVAVFYPGKCRLMFQKPNAASDPAKPASNEMQLRGHHPDCEKFSGNRITIGSSVYCAACSGLLVGAVVALGVIVLFSLGLFGAAWGNLWVLVAGEVLMLAGLAQIKARGYVKLAVNALFVVGSSLCLVASDSIMQNFLVDAYVLMLIVYLLWFRILLSEWNNKRTCLVCGHCI
jgi:hypothetical protein